MKWHRPKAILDEIARLKASVGSLQARTRDLKRDYSLFPGEREIPSAADMAGARQGLAAKLLLWDREIAEAGHRLSRVHTMPNTGAAGFLQPGTGHSCFFRAGLGTEARVKGAVAARCFGGQPGPRVLDFTQNKHPTSPPNLS